MVLQAYVDWLGTALLVWDERGFDRETGRFHERLDLAVLPSRDRITASTRSSAPTSFRRAAGAWC